MNTEQHDINTVLDELLQDLPTTEVISPEPVEEVFTASIPKPQAKKNRAPSSLLVLGCGALLAIAMGGTAILVSNRQSNSSEQNALYVAEANMRQTQRVLIERLTRTDLSPTSVTNGGWRQQAIAALSQSVLNDAETDRSNPKSVNFRRSREAALHWYLMEYVKLANLAELKGNSDLPAAKLTYQDEMGRTVTMPIPSSELSAIALNRIEATVGAQQWREIPQTNLRVNLTELMTATTAYREAYSAWLSRANLTDSAEQIREIQSWQIEQAQRPVPSVAPALPVTQQKTVTPKSQPKGGKPNATHTPAR